MPLQHLVAQWLVNYVAGEAVPVVQGERNLAGGEGNVHSDEAFVEQKTLHRLKPELRKSCQDLA